MERSLVSIGDIRNLLRVKLLDFNYLLTLNVLKKLQHILSPKHFTRTVITKSLTGIPHSTLLLILILTSCYLHRQLLSWASKTTKLHTQSTKLIYINLHKFPYDSINQIMIQIQLLSSPRHAPIPFNISWIVVIFPLFHAFLCVPHVSDSVHRTAV